MKRAPASKGFVGWFGGAINSLDVLSGANDVIVVHNKDGSLRSTPFIVRFGRFKCARPQEKIVHLEVNGTLTDVRMKIGDAGEAFFVESADEPVPPELQTSALPSPSCASPENPGTPSGTCSPIPWQFDKEEVKEAQGDPVSALSEQLDAVAEAVVEDPIAVPLPLSPLESPSLSSVDFVPRAPKRQQGIDWALLLRKLKLIRATAEADEPVPNEANELDAEPDAPLIGLDPVQGSPEIAAGPNPAEPPVTQLSPTECELITGSSPGLTPTGPRSVPSDELPSSVSPLSTSPGLATGRLTPTNAPVGQSRLQKTTLPSSTNLQRLNLQPGPNTIRFIVHTSLRGEQPISARVYLWPESAKIVISDVDGTVTKSDLLGHILPMVGVDWSHAGIANLYTKISEHGYRVMYLSSRSVSQAAQTRAFLFNIKQGDHVLPDGPLIVSPDRIFDALHREVILKKPEEFKIAALESVAAAFPTGRRPFFSGFGNRLNDELSYRAVGIPQNRIFIINPTGAIRILNYKYNSYSSVGELAQHVFPPLAGSSLATAPQAKAALELLEPTTTCYDSFQFWSLPLPEETTEQKPTTEKSPGKAKGKEKDATKEAATAPSAYRGWNIFRRQARAQPGAPNVAAASAPPTLIIDALSETSKAVD